MVHEEFISEAIEPDEGSGEMSMMARGEPGVPSGFRWRGVHYGVAAVLASWKTSSPGVHSVYLRRHWFDIRTQSGETMTLYCLRQARPGQARWWLYKLVPASQQSR